MKMTMLGTGNAGVTECYNTCFVLSENGRLFSWTEAVETAFFAS